jgi:hypothetical protein
MSALQGAGDASTGNCSAEVLLVMPEAGSSSHLVHLFTVVLSKQLLYPRQWNLDIIGVAGIEAEAELLAALVTFFKAAGLGPQDVGIKVQWRKHPYSQRDGPNMHTSCCKARFTDDHHAITDHSQPMLPLW